MDFEQLQLALRIRQLEQENDMLNPLNFPRLTLTSPHGMSFSDTCRRN